MIEKGESSASDPGRLTFQLASTSFPSVEDDGAKLMCCWSSNGGSRNSSPLGRCCSGNTSPLGRAGWRNTSPSRQKVMKTKPRGLDEEMIATFSKAVHPDVQMEDSIWAMLPEDLLNEILVRVPPFMIFRLRSVCKRWNSILQDNSFLKFHYQVPSHGPCLLTFWRNAQTPQCSVFSLPLKTWYRIPFTFLPTWALWLVGSSGGLVCFSGLDGLTFRTLIYNPLTQSWRTLPSMHYNQQRQLIMVVDRKDRSFKVIATSDIYGDKSLPTEVYDSKLNRWSLHQMMPAVNLCSSKMAFCDSRLYLETLSPLGLMMYRLDTGYWEHIPAKFPRSLLDGYLVAGSEKRLFLVGRIGVYSTHQSMRIWELDHAKTQWIEICRMPHKYFRALLRLSAERFECFGQDNLICFTSWNQGKGLLYDVDKKVWSWIAGCAWQSYNSQVCFYEPSDKPLIQKHMILMANLETICCFLQTRPPSSNASLLSSDVEMPPTTTAAVIDDINRLNNGISPMETAAVEFFSSHDSPAPTAQQRREQLQAEVLMHQKMLTREQQIGTILQCLTDRKNTTPLHIPDFIPHEVKDLIVEIATVEDEITRLENQIQHLQIEVTQEQETTRRRDYLKQSQRTPYSRPTTTTSTTTTTTNNNTPAAGGDGYFSLQQLISRSSVEASNPTDQKVVGFETKALHFISKAINGNYSLSDFSDKAASRLVTPQKENGFQERVIKRSNSVLKPSSSPLRDLRHPTPRPKDRINLAEFPIDLPRKPMASIPAIVEETMLTTTTSHGGQKVLPNKLSENIIKCLLLIYVRLMRTSRQIEIEKSGPVSSRSTISSVSFRADAAGNNQVLSTSLILNKEYSKQQDPYGVFDLEDSIPRDIGPYKNLVVFSSTSLDPKCLSKATSIPLFQKLRGLLNSLQTVDLRSLSDQQKLAFWINMYNACIMHGYLQFGVPSSPTKLLSLMNKATLNIGGNIVNAQAIEHYILRKPSSPSITKEVATGGMKGDKSGKETVIRELYGLESLNPNVIFALSCGTRSSPAVRIYTSEGVISELEKSKLDYLQASISVTNTKKIALPELLTQNVLDFASDMETLLEWVCQQLPASGSLRKSIVDCFRVQPHTSISRNVSPTGTSVINLPYEFDFQYLLAI